MTRLLLIIALSFFTVGCDTESKSPKESGQMVDEWQKGFDACVNDRASELNISFPSSDRESDAISKMIKMEDDGQAAGCSLDVITDEYIVLSEDNPCYQFNREWQLARSDARQEGLFRFAEEYSATKDAAEKYCRENYRPESGRD